MKENSVVEKQETVKNIIMPESRTPNLDKITGKYRVTPCKKSWIETANPNAKNFVMFDKAEFWLPAPRSKDIQDAVITNISKAEQAEFENEMNLLAGSMSPFNLLFWSRPANTMKISKNGLSLDCDNNIKHKMFYRLLEANGSKVAFGKDSLTLNSSAEILVENVLEQAKIDTKNLNTKAKAFAKFASMSLNEKIDFLKVFNDGSYKVNDNTASDFIDATIGMIVDGKPSDFLSAFDNPMYKDFILAHNLINKNVIIRKGGIYSVNGGEPLGSTILDVVLQLKDKKNEALKIALLAKLENTK